MSNREELRRWRRFMRKKIGPNWLAESVAALDRDEPEWTRVEMTVYDRSGEVLKVLVLFCRGGYAGEALPFDPALEEFCAGAG